MCEREADEITSVRGRSNEDWLRHLSSKAPEQQEAIADLRGSLLRGLRRSVGHRADAAFLEDAAQDALVRILERLPQFEGRSQFVTWATSIAIRVALSELRRSRWKDVSLDELTAETDSHPGLESSHGLAPTAHLERRALLDTMHQIIQTELTAKQRTALYAELKGMPLDEIARLFGSNRNAIYKLTHDARKRLKQGLLAAGFQVDDVRSAFVM